MLFLHFITVTDWSQWQKVKLEEVAAMQKEIRKGRCDFQIELRSWLDWKEKKVCLSEHEEKEEWRRGESAERERGLLFLAAFWVKTVVEKIWRVESRVGRKAWRFENDFEAIRASEKSRPVSCSINDGDCWTANWKVEAEEEKEEEKGWRWEAGLSGCDR